VTLKPLELRELTAEERKARELAVKKRKDGGSKSTEDQAREEEEVTILVSEGASMEIGGVVR
jgi:hypothetical protein